MNILSLFDGISCGRLALERAGIKVDSYFASEIDKYAIQIAKKNYPDTIHIGSVTDIQYSKRFYGNTLSSNQGQWDNIEIDLLIGGSPCQDLSIAKKGGKGLQGEKSSLFFEYVRILKEVKPKYFLLENVASMKKTDKEEITRILTEIYPDTQCYAINSALVSAQQRKRLYWTNIQGVTQPEDKGILLKDILIDGIETKEKSLCITATYSRACPRDYFEKSSRQLIRIGEFNKGGQGDRVYSIDGKSVSLSANGGGRGAKTGIYETNQGVYRKLHPVEAERLQTLPDGYTEGVSNTQRYKAIGNGWTVDVIKHIFSYIK